jgi:hypothetical protein
MKFPLPGRRGIDLQSVEIGLRVKRERDGAFRLHPRFAPTFPFFLPFLRKPL